MNLFPQKHMIWFISTKFRHVFVYGCVFKIVITKVKMMFTFPFEVNKIWLKLPSVLLYIDYQ